MSEDPKFSEILWEWRSFSKKYQKSLLNELRDLPVKFDRPTKMTDNYVLTPNAILNTKLRDKDLKIKQLLDSRLCYWDDTYQKRTKVEQWITEIFGFPISTFLLKRVTIGLNINGVPESLPVASNKEQFIASLQSLSNSVKVVSVSKEREQHLLPVNVDRYKSGSRETSELVTVEISRLTSPEGVASLSIEHSNVYAVEAALSKIMKSINGKDPKRSMISMNYLEAIKVWVLGKKLFD